MTVLALLWHILWTAWAILGGLLSIAVAAFLTVAWHIDRARPDDPHLDPNAHAAAGCGECSARLADLREFAASAHEIDELEACWRMPVRRRG